MTNSHYTRAALLCFAAIIFVGISQACLAASCMDKAFTTDAMTKCSLKDDARAAARLSKSYEVVLCHLDPGERRKLEDSQRAWEAFRKADCTFWAGGGSISAMNYNLCRADLADKRAKELDQWPTNTDRAGLAACTKKPAR